MNYLSVIYCIEVDEVYASTALDSYLTSHLIPCVLVRFLGNALNSLCDGLRSHFLQFRSS